MKKYAIIVLLILCIFSITGCKKDKEVNGDLVENDSTSETIQTDVPKETIEVNPEGTSIEVGTTIDNSSEGTPVTDATLLGDFQAYIEKFYYNFLFAPKSEAGEITEMDMQLFAISYIYQYEYTDLRFDADQFVLYIPDKKVSEVIKRFFGHDFVNHKYPADTKIAYEDGYYLMPARDEQFGPKPAISEVLKISDSDYKIVFASTEEGAAVEHFEAMVEESEGKYIMMNFKKVSDVTVQTTEGTTESTQDDKTVAPAAND